MSQKKSVQLVGKELEQARRDTKEAVEKLGRIAALTLEKIGHKPTRLARVGSPA